MYRMSLLPTASTSQVPASPPKQRSRQWSAPTLSQRLWKPKIIIFALVWTLGIYSVHQLLPLPIPSFTRIKPPRPYLPESSPSVPVRKGDDHLDSIDPRWRPFVPLEPPDAPFPRLRPTRFLPPKCLEQWFANGEMLCGKGELGEEEKLDATWTWVNGTDPRWRESMISYRAEEGIYSPEHHFREQNELKYSIRSVLNALPGKLRTIHLITADFEFTESDSHLLPNTTLDPSELRIAQTPVWLDFSRRDPKSPTHPYHPISTEALLGRLGELTEIEKSFPTLRYTTHSEIFHLPTLDRNGRTEELGEREWREAKWRKAALPSFNSMAIESRIGWVPGLADATLAMNDDFFMLRPHAVSDFHSIMYGSVIRFDHGFYSQIKPIFDKTRINDAGEVGGLYHANYVLSKRFPRRMRPYFAHVPKVITRSLHHEASLMFQEDLQKSSQRRFREVHSGDGDIQMQWLLSSLRVERWREALLWTYIVANLGKDGFWGDEARMELIDMFDLHDEDDVYKIEVIRGERWTTEPGRVYSAFDTAGWEAPKATEILFSSMDGHLPKLHLPSQPDPNARCMIDLDRCFGPFWSRDETTPTDDMFKRLTFQYPECGDCLITALVSASGPLGLSAFLPPKGTEYTNPSTKPLKYLPPPHLPLTPTWQEADFSLDSVMAETALPGETVDLRVYTMKLLSRYLYLSAKSNSHFHMLLHPEHATKTFDTLDHSPDVSVLCLNDDIERDYDETVSLMQRWFESRWPRKAVWERGWHPVRDSIAT